MWYPRFCILSFWLLPTLAASSIEGLIEFFNIRKAKGSTFCEDDLIDMVIQSKELFFKVIEARRDSFGERLFINAFILSRASFTDCLSAIDYHILFQHFKSAQIYITLPRALHSTKMRLQALQFFIKHPNFIVNSPKCYKMLLLLFCDCDQPHLELSIDTLRHIIANILKSRDVFESLLVQMINCPCAQGSQFIYNLWHYWSFSQSKTDMSLYEFLMAAYMSSNEQKEIVLKFFQADWFKCPLEWCNSFISINTPSFFRDFIAFIQYCDPKSSRQIIEQMINVCKKRELWGSFKFLMQFLPPLALYNYIVSYGSTLSSLANDESIPESCCHISLTDIYLLSRFAVTPSQMIREYILLQEPDLQAYEPNEYIVKEWVGQYELPADVLLAILSRTDPITQLLTTPLVCKAWREIRQQLLETSPIIHSQFILDIRKYGRDNIHLYLPWRAVFGSSSQVVRFFASFVTFSSTVRGSSEHRLMCEKYFHQFVTQNLDSVPSMIKFYAQEYHRIAVSIDWPEKRLPLLKVPNQMTMDDYGEVVRILVSDHLIIPSLPSEFYREKLVELHRVVKDDIAFKTILTTLSKPCFDIICANILAQQLTIPPSLVCILSANVGLRVSLKPIMHYH